ncbi:MAG: S-methyl-5-thioribose-1-phosphate isomerase [Candidatus Muirbacterium halophilum]|nr:S-methyl-5-thioribose-1-phosphate isomerase [Candidatus Muirbacterium halophilum]MCK9475364.1 S-methyl-5-thioribose-1-phosphate isomerase [Candidatus Muirbacterium halophilum]
MKVKAIQPDNNSKTLKLIDQRILPVKLEFFLCKSSQDCSDSIRTMIVRGAPAIGITAIFGAYFAWIESNCEKEFFDKCQNIKKARPTAVNLMWAIDKAIDYYKKIKNNSINDISQKLWDYAVDMLKEDISINENIGKHGVEITKSGMSILTHCNAGALATGGYGTALGVIRSAWKKHKNIKVFVDETRPYLQGSRLTAWEMHEEKIPYTMICDNMAAFFMGRNEIDMVVTGADRIALNGDSANKIGTYGVAILAAFHKIPFYIAAPKSTFDTSIHTGKEIPIEFREPEEVRSIGGKNITFEECNILNPSFDVTPAELITGIITEEGIIKAPYTENIKKLFKMR